MLDFFGISLGTEPWHAERIFFLKDPQAVNAVEMKNRSLVPRNVSRWTTKGVSQFAAVVKQFKQCNPGEDSLVNGEHAAYVCNQQSPYVVEYASTNDKMSFLMDHDTWGFQLYIKKLIVIENAK